MERIAATEGHGGLKYSEKCVACGAIGQFTGLLRSKGRTASSEGNALFRDLFSGLISPGNSIYQLTRVIGECELVLIHRGGMRRCQLRPLVLGLDGAPLITDPERAKRDPELSVMTPPTVLDHLRAES